MGQVFRKQVVTEVDAAHLNRKVRVSIDQETGEVFVEGTKGVTVTFPFRTVAAPHQEPDDALYVRATQIVEDVEVNFSRRGGSFAGGELAGPILKAWIVSSPYRGWQERLIKQGIHFIFSPNPYEKSQEICLMPLAAPVETELAR